MVQGKKKHFGLAAQPEAKECSPPPSPGSLLLSNHKTFRNSFQAVPPSFLPKKIGRYFMFSHT